MKLKVVTPGMCEPAPAVHDAAQALADHIALIDSFFQSQRVRNYSQRTIDGQRRFLTSWFEQHGPEYRPLYTWEAMRPVSGRRRILDYSRAMLDSGLQSETVRSYMTALKLYFAFVLEFPYLARGAGHERLHECYGAIEQPITDFDMPPNAKEGERDGTPIDPARLYEFYSVALRNYVRSDLAQFPIRARNYTMAVLAGESGLRIDEICHLEVSRDLFFESGKLQTRHAKAKRGSGKRSRMTLFTPLARDTVRFYLKEARPHIRGAKESDLLFLSREGLSINQSSTHRALQEMVKQIHLAGFPVAPHMSWHWFRRLFATRFIERFPNQLSVLIRLLGHVSPHTVHCYIRHSEAWMDNEIQSVIKGVGTCRSGGD